MHILIFEEVEISQIVYKQKHVLADIKIRRVSGAALGYVIRHDIHVDEVQGIIFFNHSIIPLICVLFDVIHDVGIRI